MEVILDILKQFKDESLWSVNLSKPNIKGVEQLGEIYALPADYEMLLSITDGITLFNSGDHHIIRSVSDVFSINKDLPLNKDVYEVGYLLDHIIVINGSEFKTAKYLYAAPSSCFDEFVCIENMTAFLKTILEHKTGDVYWNYNNPLLFHDFT